MNLNDIKYKVRLGKKAKRVGRGVGSGLGKTCGKGHKGLKARAGADMGLTYEGGQMPLWQRIAKRGFNNARYAVIYDPVNICFLESFDEGSTIGLQELRSKGLLDNVKHGVKILGDGSITKKLTVRAQAFSKSAQAAIEAVGGTCEIVKNEG